MKVTSPNHQLLADLDGVSLHKTPPAAYLEWLATNKSFFDGPAWGEVLQNGLGARRFYLWDCVFKQGHALTCFRKGPFYIGYLGFPLCAAASVDGQPYVLDRMISAIRAMPHRPQLLRLPIFAFGDRAMTIGEKEKSRWAVESCIADLQAWRSDATSVRRRDLNFARKRCGSMTIVNIPAGRGTFDLYTAAVTRHRGNVRYTSRYFAALEGMLTKSAIRAYTLSDEKGLAGMVITADHGETCYYLHGGTRSDALRLGIADQLLVHAITNARERGLARFNLLTSPKEQTGLIRFKEKWGGTSLPAQTIDIPINGVGQMLAQLLG